MISKTRKGLCDPGELTQLIARAVGRLSVYIMHCDIHLTSEMKGESC